MKLKYKYEKQADVPPEVTQHYTEQNGAFLLNVEGAMDRTKLDEFQREKISLLTQLDEVKRRYEGIDPEAVRKLEAEKQKLEEQQALKAGEVERVIESRLKSFQSVHEKQVKDLAAERDALVARLSEIQIDQGVVGVAARYKLHPTAIPDITARARQTFKLVKGVPTAFAPDGQSVRPGSDGISPMTLEEWLESQVREAPHLFGTRGGGPTVEAPETYGLPSKNPYKKETWNLTEQVRLQKTNPQMAAMLKAQTS
jgi:hypothetical protein